jgi:hypothetical protein
MFLTTNNTTTTKSFLFTLLAGAQLLTQTSGQEYVLDVEEEYEYGAPITVDFMYSVDTEPRGSNFIGLYNIKKNGNLKEYMWSDTCGSQKSWDDPELCDPPTSGSVTFTAEDPNHEVNGWQWALPKGNYKACLVDYLEEEDEYVDLACTDFIIKKIPEEWKCETSIIPHSRTYTASDGDLQVSFSFVGLPILNTWIGIYKKADLPTNKGFKPIDFEPIYWTYAGCDSKDGDQEENNDCSVAVEHGTKTFDMSDSEDYPDDEYFFCIVYDNNSPYREFKCSGVVVFET